MSAVLLVFQYGSRASSSRWAGWPAAALGREGPPHDAGAHITTLITGIFVGLWSLIGDAGETYNLTNIGTLFAFVLVSIGVLVLRYTDRDRPRPFRVPFVWAVSGHRRGVMRCS